MSFLPRVGRFHRNVTDAIETKHHFVKKTYYRPTVCMLPLLVDAWCFTNMLKEPVAAVCASLAGVRLGIGPLCLPWLLLSLLYALAVIRPVLHLRLVFAIDCR